jgi:uncharacterized protein YjbI with pentapeptide repeats
MAAAGSGKLSSEEARQYLGDALQLREDWAKKGFPEKSFDHIITESDNIPDGTNIPMYIAQPTAKGVAIINIEDKDQSSRNAYAWKRWCVYVDAYDQDTKLPKELFFRRDKSSIGFNIHNIPSTNGKNVGWVGGTYDSKNKDFYVTELQADIAQRTNAIAKRSNPAYEPFRKQKSVIENTFRKFFYVFFNDAVKNAVKKGAARIFVPTGQYYQSTGLGLRKEVSDRYDHLVQNYPYEVSPNGRWYVMNVADLTRPDSIIEKVDWDKTNPKEVPEFAEEAKSLTPDQFAEKHDSRVSPFGNKEFDSVDVGDIKYLWKNTWAGKVKTQSVFQSWRKKVVKPQRVVVAAKTEIRSCTGTVLYTGHGSLTQVLEKAVGEGVSLHNADLRNADLRNAYLRNADLQSANLHGANLQSANLRGADLQFADLRNADLTNADLQSAKLTGAYLRNADLRNADLTNADLTATNLHGANLRGADLQFANLYRANLTNANLTDANLTGANLQFADLSNANITEEQLGSCADLKNATGITVTYAKKPYQDNRQQEFKFGKRLFYTRNEVESWSNYLRSANASLATLKHNTRIAMNLVPEVFEDFWKDATRLI